MELSAGPNWGKPERAPHIRDICKFCLSVYLSVGPYVHNTIIYKCYSNLRIPSIVDCSFEQYVSQTVLYPNIQEILTLSCINRNHKRVVHVVELAVCSAIDDSETGLAARVKDTRLQYRHVLSAFIQVALIDHYAPL